MAIKIGETRDEHWTGSKANFYHKLTSPFAGIMLRKGDGKNEGELRRGRVRHVLSRLTRPYETRPRSCKKRRRFVGSWVENLFETFA